MSTHTRTHLLPLVGLLACLILALCARLLLMARGDFDGLYGQDAFAYYHYAVGPLRESIPAFAGPPPFHWPPGFPYLIALTTLLTGVTPLAGQAVSLAASLLVPLFTALLAWEVWGRKRNDGWVPAMAGILVTMNGQFWQSSIVVMADTAGLAAATLGMWALARFGRPARAAQRMSGLWWLLLAAFALSFAVLNRWAYALTALPATGYALLVLWRRRAWIPALLAAGVTLLTLSPMLAPVLGRLLGVAGTGPTFTIDLEVYRWNPVNAFRRSFVTADGLLQYRLPNGLYYSAAPAHRYFFTPLLALFLLPGFWFTWKQRSSALLWLVWGWAGVILAFHAGAAWQNFRFTLAYLPPLAILTAVGVVGAAQLAGRLRPLYVAVVAAGLLWMSWGGWTLSNSFIERKNGDLMRMRWVESKTVDQGRLVTFNDTLTFQHYSSLETYELYFQTPASLETLAESAGPLYLFIDVNSVESQWQGLAPSENYRRLRDGPGLREIGRSGTFTLFEVNRR